MIKVKTKRGMFRLRTRKARHFVYYNGNAMEFDTIAEAMTFIFSMCDVTKNDYIDKLNQTHVARLEEIKKHIGGGQNDGI